MTNATIDSMERNAEHVARCHGLDERHVLLIEQVRSLVNTLRLRTGQVYMAVDRLGGQVEGQPTSELNFLQRIDVLKSLEDAVVPMLFLLAERLDQTGLRAREVAGVLKQYGCNG